MNRQDHDEKQVDAILESLNKVLRASPQPYLFTRIKARMERGKESTQQSSKSFFAKPAFVLAGLVLVLVVNAFILLRQGSSSGESQTLTGQNEQVTTDNDYLMATTSSYDYENIEQ